MKDQVGDEFAKNIESWNINSDVTVIRTDTRKIGLQLIEKLWVDIWWLMPISATSALWCDFHSEIIFVLIITLSYTNNFHEYSKCHSANIFCPYLRCYAQTLLVLFVFSLTKISLCCIAHWLACCWTLHSHWHVAVCLCENASGFCGHNSEQS